MTVAELIAQLSEYPGHFKVVQSSDPEGNDFHTTYDIGHGVYDERHGEFTNWADDEDSDRSRTVDESDTVCIWP